MKKIVVLVLCSLFILVAAAADERYPFIKPEREETFNRLTRELRCLVCQNQNLAESHAPLAEDLRRQVYRQVIQGKSEEQIKTYMVERYGDFILYKPTFNPRTWILWGGPFLLVVLAIGGFVIFIRRLK